MTTGVGATVGCGAKARVRGPVDRQTFKEHVLKTTVCPIYMRKLQFLRTKNNFFKPNL